MLLMISTINFHYALGKEAAHTRPVYGPATEAQRASHMRLSVAADALVDRAPSDMVLQDWSEELNQAMVSYTGEEVVKCLSTEACLLEPTLPPAELTGSIELADLLEGTTREVIVEPSKLRRTDDQFVQKWPKPRIHAKDKKEEKKILKMLYQRRIVDPVDESEMRHFEDEAVSSGIFGVLKPKKQKVRK